MFGLFFIVFSFAGQFPDLFVLLSQAAGPKSVFWQVDWIATLATFLHAQFVNALVLLRICRMLVESLLKDSFLGPLLQKGTKDTYIFETFLLKRCGLLPRTHILEPQKKN